MPKVVINISGGGFRLSKQAVKRLAELLGRACYFFVPELGSAELFYRPLAAYEENLFWVALDIPNPNDVFRVDARLARDEKRRYLNDLCTLHMIPDRKIKRDHPLLVQVVEELGSKRASEETAHLQIVDIPDGVEWHIEECAGREHVAERHRTWGRGDVGVTHDD